jgi:hypothetical protein
MSVAAGRHIVCSMQAAPPLPLLKASVRSFLQQFETRKTLQIRHNTWPALRDPIQRFAAHLASPDLRLDDGDVRAKPGVEEAYVCQWPAHRLGHPDLLRRQADALTSAGVGAVDLAEALVLLAPSRELFWIDLAATKAADRLDLYTRMVRPGGGNGVQQLRHDVPLVLFVLGELEGPADAACRAALTAGAFSTDALIGRGSHLRAALQHFTVPWPVTLTAVDQTRGGLIALDPWTVA